MNYSEENGIIYLGDSVLRRLLETRALPHYYIGNGTGYPKKSIQLCIGGQSPLQLKKRIVRYLKSGKTFGPKVVVHTGSNDVLKNKDPKKTLAEIGKIIKILRKVSRVYLCTIGPIINHNAVQNIQRINEGIRQRCRNGAATLIDVAAIMHTTDLKDNVHLKATGVEKLDTHLKYFNL